MLLLCCVIQVLTSKAHDCEYKLYKSKLSYLIVVAYILLWQFYPTYNYLSDSLVV